MNQEVRRGFASDNNAGIDPELLVSIAEANNGHTIAYGDDVYTDRAEELIRNLFGPQAEVFFVLTGTGANVLSLSSVTRSFNGIICAETAHIQVDECGAPEKFIQCKLLPVPTPDGKLTPDLVSSRLHGFGFEHHVQPGAISISQTTEMGTVYSPDEIRSLAALAGEYGMFLHMDGARLANAAVSLGVSFRSITTDAGVDVLSFGGTKNGMLFGEAVVFLKPGLSQNFRYLRKQGMQLASKMRFLSAQFVAYLEQEIWVRNAQHANNMAQLLYDGVSGIHGVTVTQPVQANAVFAIIPSHLIEVLQKQYFFYVWDESRSEVRWMTSFDTTAEDVAGFCKVLEALLSGS
jgi:threonine aldolase